VSLLKKALGIGITNQSADRIVMSLKLKFSVVLMLLVVALGVNAVLSVWSIRFLERELAWPLRSVQPVLTSLHHIKRFGEQGAKDLSTGRFWYAHTKSDQATLPDPKRMGPRIIEAEKKAGIELDRLKGIPTAFVRSGVSTIQNLQLRSEKIISLATEWVESGSPDAYDQLVGHIKTRHELIERIEGRILQDAQLATSYGEKLDFMISTIVGISVVGALSSVAYAAILLRRWIIEPVGLLREGAKRFGRGDFDHRIEIATGDELGQLGDEFNTMSSLIMAMQNERIEQERMAAVGEMAQRTVHNLRTPLAGIRALAETTKNELGPSSELHDIQDRILKTVDRFEVWLQGMLRVSSPLSIEHVQYNPRQLVDNVVISHRDAAKARSVDLVIHSDEMPEVCVGDPHHLEHAFTAILSNAIDFSPRDGTVEIELGSDERYWTLCVRDHGPGIKPDLHMAIFRPYFTTRKEGTGIGLAMVKRIIEQHGGTVRVRTTLGPVSESGTTFVLTVPIGTSSES